MSISDKRNTHGMFYINTCRFAENIESIYTNIFLVTVYLNVIGGSLIGIEVEYTIKFFKFYHIYLYILFCIIVFFYAR